MQAGANGVIVGSELINIYSKYLNGRTINPDLVLKEIEDFAKRFL